MTTVFEPKVIEAAKELIDRKNRNRHPAGKTDNGGRWYPDDSERCECCAHIRTPSRAFPWSFMTHCRTSEHVANLYGVSVTDLRKCARQMEAEAK